MIIQNILLLLTLVVVLQAQNQCCGSFNSCCAGCQYNSSCCANCCQQTSCCQQPQSSNCCNRTCSSPDTNVPVPEIQQIPLLPKQSFEGSSSNINNTLTANFNIKLDNPITNENKIYMPVNVNSYNVNNFTEDPEIIDMVNPEPIIRSTPKYSYVLRPTVVPVPQPYPVPYYNYQQQCCSVIQPCVGNNCNQYRTVCGNQCTSPILFNPKNPCPNTNCAKKPYWIKNICDRIPHYPYFTCRSEHQDCTECNQDFYKNYETYEKCRGCFY